VRGTKDMNNTRKKTSQILEDFFQRKDMVFYRRDVNENIVTFVLPYSITKQKIKFDIQIVVFNDENICRMSFSRELNEETDYSSELLDMNSSLVHGKISVEKDSNQVTYTLHFTISEEQTVEKEYNDAFEQCLGSLARLYSKNLIKK